MIREVVCGLNYMYGVDDILGIEVTPIIILLSDSCTSFPVFATGIVDLCFDTETTFSGWI